MALIISPSALQAQAIRPAPGMPAIPDWAWRLAYPRRYKVLAGGRGAGKSWSIGIVLIWLARRSKLQILLTREVQESISKSNKRVIEDLIRLFWPHDVGTFWKIGVDKITGANGSLFETQGMSDITSANIMSLEGANIIWFEQAEAMSAGSWTRLDPTVRKQGSEIWLSLNPRYRNDPAYELFMLENSPRADPEHSLIQFVTYKDNPFFTEENERSRMLDEEADPVTYRNTWLGEPDDEGQTNKIIPYAVARACVEAWTRWAPANNYVPTGRIDAGQDIADAQAGDWNALVGRRGPLIMHAETMESATYERLCRSRRCVGAREHVVRRIYYDSAPAGSMRSEYNRIRKERGRRYSVESIGFGSKVTGGDIEFTTGEKNEDHFKHRSAQMAWSVRIRANRTMRLLDGQKMRPDECLFIDPSGVESVNLGTYLGQISQPEWKLDTSSRIWLDKSPKIAEGSRTKMPSPDLWDATILAFARDSEYGLSLGRRDMAQVS